MTVNVQDLVTLADALSNGQGEIEWRSGASRGYYAMFHKARDVCDACLGPSPYAEGAHEKLTNRLIEHTKQTKNRQAMSLAYRLIDFKKVRTKADYKLGAAFRQQDATDLVAQIGSVHEQVDDFASNFSGNAASGP
ncbi:hypothetical protein [Burkholderia multivorans]|uniref:HEPN domain-containing protein n=2 Tax=Burkholderia multivorans TaxID=87883 RepID=A0A2S9M9B9_9BURK|nr:hypothetical protein [Burkholderia multivorans]MBU9516750.1 hypothetical protein [Burkholderia multivorans]PRE98392.1 hypothetical protein C6Q07_29690 [Burkholderia multivorans]PRF53744.1 hypothetical protein C6Q15_29465 [Burkholderia multivorans]